MSSSIFLERQSRFLPEFSPIILTTVSGRFAYGRCYLERQDALPVDPVALPLGGMPRDVSANGGLYGAFRDASPDYWGRLVIAAELKTPPESLKETSMISEVKGKRRFPLDSRTTPGSFG